MQSSMMYWLLRSAEIIPYLPVVLLPFNSESWLDYYVKENGISPEDADAMMTALSINCRRAAALNPLSTITNNTYEELAAANGMDSAYEYLHSKSIH